MPKSYLVFSAIVEKANYTMLSIYLVIRFFRMPKWLSIFSL